MLEVSRSVHYAPITAARHLSHRETCTGLTQSGACPDLKQSILPYQNEKSREIFSIKEIPFSTCNPIGAGYSVGMNANDPNNLPPVPEGMTDAPMEPCDLMDTLLAELDSTPSRGDLEAYDRDTRTVDDWVQRQWRDKEVSK